MNHKYLIVFLLLVGLSIIPASAITVDNTTHYVLNLSNITITNPETSNFSAIVVQSDYVYFQGADYKTYTFSFLPIIANYTYGIFIVNENGLAIATMSNATGYATLNYIPNSNATANFSIYAISYCVDTTACGYVLSAQGLDGIDASVNLWNASYNVNITSNISTGYYIFTNISNGTYNINASKIGYGTVTDTVTVSGYGFKILVLYPQYSLTVYVRDVNSKAYLSPFFVTLNNTITSWGTNPANYSILNYGIYTISVSTTAYYPQTQTILLSGNQTIFFDLSLVTSGTIFKTLPHNVRFAIQDYFNNPLSGVYVTVQGYNTTVGGFSFLSDLLGLTGTQSVLLNQSMNGTTGTDGSVVFMLDPTINYKITFNRIPDVNITWWLYPKEDYYLVLVPTTGTNAICSNVAFNLTNVVKNSTFNTLGLTYIDTANTTTQAYFFVQNVNGTYFYSVNTTYPTSWTPSYDVNSSLGFTYFWGFNATTSSCTNQIAQTQVITFKGSGRLIDLHISNPVYYQWISIMLLVFTTSLFSIKKVKFGAVIVPLSAGMYAFFGWFTVNPIILGSAIVIGILIYMRMSEVKVNF